MHKTTFGYIKPTDAQLETMDALREHTNKYAHYLETYLPDGPDKTYVLRKLRELSMWSNVAITRLPDGTPRE